MSFTKTKQDHSGLSYEEEQLIKIKALCDAYQKHLGNSNTDVDIMNKRWVVSSMKDVLNTEESSSTKIEKLRKILAHPDNKKTLIAHRSSVATRFVQVILNILSLGFYSNITKGTFAFWKSHGEVLADNIDENINKKPGKK